MSIKTLIKKFFEEKGYAGVRYHVVDGRMPCAIAVITKAGGVSPKIMFES